MDSNNDDRVEAIQDDEQDNPFLDGEESISPEEEAREMAAVSEEISKRRRRRMFIAIFLILAITWVLGQFGDPFVPPQ